MNKYIENIISFFTDRSKKLSIRTAIFVVVLVLTYLIDNSTGFSYYYFNSRKIEQIKGISILLNDTSLDDSTRNYLLELRKETFNRNTHMSDLLMYLKKITTKNNSNINIRNGVKLRSEFWFLMSTSGLYILIALFVPLLLILDKDNPLFKRILIILSLEMFLFLYILVFYWVLNFLFPNQIWGNWVWNYIINAILQIVTISAFWALNFVYGKN